MGALRRLDLAPLSVNLDAPPSRLEQEWSDGRNVRFSAQAARSVDGESVVYPGTPGPCYWARWAWTSGIPILYYAGANFVGCYDGAHHNLTPAGWAASPTPESISGLIFNDYAIINAPPNTPHYIPYTRDACLELPGWPAGFTARGLASFKNSLVAFGLTETAGTRNQTVRWSDSADPGTLPGEWIETPTNDAGFLLASQYSGPLVAAAELGDDQLALYKTGAAFALSYIGGQFVMALRLLPGISGALGLNSVYALGSRNVLLTDGDLVMHNGSGEKSLIDGRARRYLFNAIDPAYATRCYVCEDIERGEVVVAYPKVGSAGALVEALIWAYESDEISFRDLSKCNALFTSRLVLGRKKWSPDMHAPWSTLRGRWNDQAQTGSGMSLLTCDAINPQFLALDGGSTVNGAPIVAMLERVGIPLGNGDRMLLKRIVPRVSGQVGGVIQIRAGMQDLPDDPIAWDAPQNYTIGSSERVDCMLSGRFAAVRFLGSVPYGVAGFTLAYSGQGRQ